MSDKRRSDRVDLLLPIEIIGTDLLGIHFFRKGTASVIGRNGAAIQLDSELVSGQVVTIRNLNNSKECEATVVGSIGQHDNKCSYGVVLADVALNLWDLEFPELVPDQPPIGRIVLSCKVCNRQEVVHLNEIEIHVLETARTLRRHCRICRSETSWFHTSLKEEAITLPEPSELLTESSQVNSESGYGWKRKYKRIPTTFPACVRQCGPPGEIVVCDNISRGGICFRSQNRYQPDTHIEVAVPYETKGSGNIFVPARIVHVDLFGRLFRHGAAYL